MGVKRIISGASWGIVATLCVIPVLYFVTHLGDQNFVAGTLGNWFATMVGVVVGIPIALALSRWQQSTEERRLRSQTEREAQTQKAKILVAIRTELNLNLELLASRREKIDTQDQRIVQLPPLKDELWNAFSDGGELQWIKDVELLNALSSAYHDVRTVKFLEEQYFESLHYPGIRIQRDKHSHDQIMDYLDKMDPSVIQDLKRGIDLIDSVLSVSATAMREGELG